LFPWLLKIKLSFALGELRLPENSVSTWHEFLQRYGESIQESQIQLERDGNYNRYKKLAETWKDLNIESWFLVREILHRKKFILIKNDFPPVGLPEGVKVYTFWINKHELSDADQNEENYELILKEHLAAEGVDPNNCIYYMRDQSQMSIPQYPHFHVYINTKDNTTTTPAPHLSLPNSIHKAQIPIHQSHSLAKSYQNSPR
jgi:hypothetical protein